MLGCVLLMLYLQLFLQAQHDHLITTRGHLGQHGYYTTGVTRSTVMELVTPPEGGEREPLGPYLGIQLPLLLSPQQPHVVCGE